MQFPPPELKEWEREHLFDAIPMSIAAIDHDFNIVHANLAFERMFGSWRNRKCFDVYKDRDSLCPSCTSSLAFKDGKTNISEEQGYDRDGRAVRYIKHIFPMKDEDGKIPYLIEMSTDITDVEQMRREYQLLFDQVPCHVILINRDLQIVRANQRTREMLGNIVGRPCYEALKGHSSWCSECTTLQTFRDGLLHTGHHIWKSEKGEVAHQHVITVPLRMEDGSFDVVMEMAVDVTHTLKLEDGLRYAHNYLQLMIAASTDGIFAIDKKGKVEVFNPSARNIFNTKKDQIITRDNLASMLPKGFLARVSSEKGPIHLPETELKTIDGNVFPARLTGSRLFDKEEPIGMAFSVQDMSEIRRLEREKMEAERQAIVGQTVAGLAHGIKNLVIALEGGIYMLNSGLNKSDIDRVGNGLDTLVRNIDRISTFVKAFLNFSRDRLVEPRLCNPADIAEEVAKLHIHMAKEHGIRIENEISGQIDPAAIDYEKMHEGLTNLIGNAIDACRAEDGGDGKVIKLRTFEEGRIIHYEITDNGCGMDAETRDKAFNKFFTTKGLQGTGLGMLMARKIVQEHGGKIDLKSELGTGTTVRIQLPRRRLPRLKKG